MTAMNGISPMRGATCSIQLRGPRSLPPITSTASNVPMPVASTSPRKGMVALVRDADVTGEVDETGLRARNEAEVEQAGWICLPAVEACELGRGKRSTLRRQAHEGEACIAGQQVGEQGADRWPRLGVRAEIGVEAHQDPWLLAERVERRRHPFGNLGVR